MTPWEQYSRGDITKSQYHRALETVAVRERRLEHDRERNRQWRENNVERRRDYVRQNSAKYVAYNIRRVQRESKATPKWLTAEQWEMMNAIYEMARLLTRLTGQLYHVDHLWPLKGANSCGFHVPWNLRVVTQAENDSKGKAEPSAQNPLVKRDACILAVAINLLPMENYDAQGYECLHYV